ncbi:hypothetical protein P8452_37486 [Trifolium repens]|nr:hypothetical protein P8452_37486 [Trifolium repens]
MLQKKEHELSCMHLNHFLKADSRERITFSCWKKKLWIQEHGGVERDDENLMESLIQDQRSVCIRDEAFRSSQN